MVHPLVPPRTAQFCLWQDQGSTSGASGSQGPNNSSTSFPHSDGPTAHSSVVNGSASAQPQVKQFINFFIHHEIYLGHIKLITPWVTYRNWLALTLDHHSPHSFMVITKPLTFYTA